MVRPVDHEPHCGFELMATITKPAREELALCEGQTIVALVKAMAVHLLPRMKTVDSE